MAEWLGNLISDWPIWALIVVVIAIIVVGTLYNLLWSMLGLTTEKIKLWPFTRKRSENAKR